MVVKKEILFTSFRKTLIEKHIKEKDFQSVIELALSKLLGSKVKSQN